MEEELVIPLPPRKRRKASVPDLPAVVEEAAQHVCTYVPPEAISIDAVRSLLADEVISVYGKDENGATHTLAGQVVESKHNKIIVMNWLTGYFTPPKQEVIHFGKDVHGDEVSLWSGNPCQVHHPGDTELESISAIRERKKGLAVTEKKQRAPREKNRVLAPELTAREIALALLKRITGEPKSRATLCREAGIDVPKDKAMGVLDALANAGKIRKCVEYSEGLKVIRWATK